MKVYVGADHNGFTLKEKLEEYLQRNSYDVVDTGNQSLDMTDDYPVYAIKTAQDVLAGGEDARAILLCGSGQGMCMAANRFKGIRAAIGYDDESVRSSRNDDDANILCLPAHSLTETQVFHLADLFLSSPFAAAERYKRRIRQMDV